MSHGDRVQTGNDGEVEFLRRRDPSRVPKVIGLRDALVVAGICTGLFGGITVFSLRAMMREEIAYHNNDSRAHPAAMEPIHNHVARQEAEAGMNRDLLERVTRIEAKVTDSSESIARIEERLRLPGGKK